ncbi:MAG: exonuclease SbcCD subunit D C-terminal domain-containing protein [Bacteroides sp.]|nr:exonuclease SbcCD subunit D C-terminal domain-containing protein [Bacteroides sp.]MDD4719238.1 exonuclease SbcCD subunit D C-terminal domain-containing protein [Bacteroides sp.]
MLRILHTADWHLGQTFFGYDRTKEHLHFLKWLSNEIEKREIDVVLISGDVFDVSNPSSASQRIFYQFISNVLSNNVNLQIVIIAGNHDSASRLEAPQPLLDEERVVIKGLISKMHNDDIDYESLIVNLRNKKGEVEALCLAVPFLRQGDYPTRSNGKSNSYSEGVQAFYVEILEKAKQLKTENQALIAMGHLHTINAVHAEKDHSERIVIGGLERISPDVFTDDLAYTALGHIHKAQRVNKRENIRYAGTPLPMSFSEIDYTHGVVEVVINNGKLQSIDKHTYEPLVQLIRIPPLRVGALSPAELLNELQALPSIHKDSCFDHYPFLEINVLLTEPEPLLKNKIEEIVSHKAVRLASIRSHFKNDKADDDKQLTGELKGLEEKAPIDVAKSYYKKLYNVDIPRDLQELFLEVNLLIETKKEEKK